MYNILSSYIPGIIVKEGAEGMEDPKVVGIYPVILKDRVSHSSVAPWVRHVDCASSLRNLPVLTPLNWDYMCALW